MGKTKRKHLPHKYGVWGGRGNHRFHAGFIYDCSLIYILVTNLHQKEDVYWARGWVLTQIR